MRNTMIKTGNKKTDTGRTCRAEQQLYVQQSGILH
jgi:hypothetical protein